MRPSSNTPRASSVGSQAVGSQAGPSPAESEPDFSNAARRALFRSPKPVAEGVYEKIPGAGRSAAETPERHVRAKVTMNLDGDVVQYFKNEAGRIGRPYQALINQVLREYIEGSRPEKLAKDVAELLLDDDAFLEALRSSLGVAMSSSGEPFNVKATATK